MPISGDLGTDKNTQGFNLPSDSCVGDAGPAATAIAGNYQGTGPSSGSLPGTFRVVGDDTASNLISLYDAPAPKSRGQQATEGQWWVGSAAPAGVKVVDSGPLGCAGGDYNQNLDERQA